MLKFSICVTGNEYSTRLTFEACQLMERSDTENINVISKIDFVSLPGECHYLVVFRPAGQVKIASQEQLINLTHGNNFILIFST